MNDSVVAVAPGRVNLIGDHTDYAGGRALPMAIDLTTTVSFTPGGELLLLRSTTTGDELVLDPATEHQPGSFGAMEAGLLSILGHRMGRLEVSSTLPIGAGLSSSASLLVASAMALGAIERDLDLALLCQEAERRAGQDVGLLDQIAIIDGRSDHGVLIDFSNLSTTPVRIPDDVDIVIIHSGENRSLAAGAYATRRAEVAAVEALIGSIPLASPEAIAEIEDPLLARRAKHVWSETRRVGQVADSLSVDPVHAGRLMLESHRSLSEDFEVSTPVIDAMVTEISAHDGVFGVRMTGGGFGGCLVALTRPGALVGLIRTPTWTVQPTGGARIL